MDANKLAAKLAQVNALLDRANHPNTPAPEAESCRIAAQRIMDKYRIEEEELRQERKASGTEAKPVHVTFPFSDVLSPYLNHYYRLMVYVVNHFDLLMTYHYSRDAETGRSVYVAEITGFDIDIEMATALFTSLKLAFSEKLEPKVDPTLSDADNVYRLRSAGIERIRIAQMMWGDGSHANNSKVTRLYNEACAARGEDPKVVGRSVNAKTYRASFADGFVSEIWNRLHRMKMDGFESSALVLAGRADAVREAFYDKNPHLRPSSQVEGETGGARTCPKCEKAKSGRCRDHTYRASKPQPRSQLGYSSGVSAGRAADLGRSAAPGKIGGA